ncbi:HPr kinase/phosphorylase [Microvirga flavescens]|uniref:HPr kinase/phosphorylase n=1 Tax=Microvirga flavescens TaxID=2249811 RepID=UPI000DD66BF9|nr:serine/threonine protein kinase [Microvirga flavescens]
MVKAETIYAGCVVIGEAGILIRGGPKTGKSTLARELVFHANQACMFARLVSDDRTRIEPCGSRLVVRPVPPIEGQIEVRGVGIMAVSFEKAAVLRLVIDLFPEDPPRYPEEAEAQAVLCGVLLPRLASRTGTPLSDVVLSRLRV